MDLKEKTSVNARDAMFGKPEGRPKKIAILGSTGSIGRKAAEIIAHFPHLFDVVALSTNTNWAELEKQIHRFAPKMVGIWNPHIGERIKKDHPSLQVFLGQEGFIEMLQRAQADLVLSSMAGFDGVLPTLTALECSKELALANKEALVAAGDLVLRHAQKNKVSLIPVDSEHTSLHQALRGKSIADVHKLVITASGGPFLHYPPERLDCVTPEQALKHPNYAMGPKVSVDSSTLMNKGLEVIEAHFFYAVAPKQIEVVIHPEQIIHALVEWVDGTISAELSEPHMELALQYALCYPKKLPSVLPYFDFRKMRTLHFDKPDRERFLCLSLAYRALEVGGSMLCFMNAANEVLVKRFLEGQLSWQQIALRLERLMDRHRAHEVVDYQDLVEVDREARHLATEIE